jgi:hypothetical protein
MIYVMKTQLLRGLRQGACSFLLASTVIAVAPVLFTPAFAQEDGEGGQGQGGKADGGQGQGGQGGQSGGSGQGGPDASSDGKGPKAGSPSGSSGGKPVWAKEGIPEVELGRLSVARSPEKVLDRALAEALSNITPEIVSFYNLDLDAAIATLSLQFDSVAMYDSPLQSLALLRDALDGSSVLAENGVTNDTGTLMALFIGVASDKTLPISTETVIAVTTILGAPMTEAQAAAMAIDAEAVRVAVLAGHG